MQSTPALLTTRDVAELLGVSSQRVRQLVAERPDFPAPFVESRTTRGVGTRRWKREDVVRWNATADRESGGREAQAARARAKR